MYGYGRGFSNIPPVTKNLIMLNVLMLLVYYTAGTVFNTDLNRVLGLYFPASERFQPYQLVTHMFMHGGFTHLFFNMFALFMFGRVLETVWGPKRFFIYYIITGLGAALTHETVMAFEYFKVTSLLSSDQVDLVVNTGYDILNQEKNFSNAAMGKLNILLSTPTVGASGAVFGILLAFGMLFPNTELMLLFPPIPIKAKWLVIGYGALELWLAITMPGSTIAHAAHLGGMLFGYILIRIWRKSTRSFY